MDKAAAHMLKEKGKTIVVADDGSYIRLTQNADMSYDMRAVCMRHTIGQGASLFGFAASLVSAVSCFQGWEKDLVIPFYSLGGW